METKASKDCVAVAVDLNQILFKSIIECTVAESYINKIFIPFLQWFPMISTNNEVYAEDDQPDIFELEDGEPLSVPSDWEED